MPNNTPKGLPATVGKALTRYHDELRRRPQCSLEDRDAGFDDHGAEKEGDQSTATGSGASDGARVLRDRPEKRQEETYSESQFETGLTPLTNESDAVSQAPPLEPAVIQDYSRRRRRVRWLLFLLGMPLIIGISLLRIERDVTLQASLSVSGEERPVRGPVNGRILRVEVSSPAIVESGQLLMIIEPDATSELIEIQSEWVTAALREAALRAALGGETEVTIPKELSEPFSLLDVDASRQRASRYLADIRDGMSDELGYLQNDLDKVKVELKRVWDEEYELEERLQVVGDRLRRVQALEKQNIVYEEGVYTKDLVRRAQDARRAVLAEFTAIGEREEALTRQFREMRESFDSREQAHRSRLRTQLDQARAQADAAKSKLLKQRAEQRPLSLHADTKGYFVPAERLLADYRTTAGENLGTLTVRRGKGLVESDVPAKHLGLIQVGQTVDLVLDDAQGKVRFNGRVVSLVSGIEHAASEPNGQRVRVEFELPAAIANEGGLMQQGMPAEVLIHTDERLWRLAYRVLRDLVRDGRDRIIRHQAQGHLSGCPDRSDAVVVENNDSRRVATWRMPQCSGISSRHV